MLLLRNSLGTAATWPCCRAILTDLSERRCNCDLSGARLPIPTDVADAKAVDAAAERIERELGPIDVWVNVAMATVFAPVHKLTPEEFHGAPR